MKYSDYKRNHVIIPGQEKDLEEFLKQTYKGMKHKWEHRCNSNSEDALTWSCFKIIDNFPFEIKKLVLDELLEDSFDGKPDFKFADSLYVNKEIKIYVGKTYEGKKTKESTEVDASIELPDKLIFFEAKLYSSISLVNKEKDVEYDQIAKKLRVGIDHAQGKDFYFIFLDIAPVNKLNRRSTREEAKDKGENFHDKWKSAWWFSYYKNGRNGSLSPLRKILEDIDVKNIEEVASRMGWLTWTNLFKTILRGTFIKK